MLEKWKSVSERERDVVIAEKVMGWTKIIYDEDSYCGEYCGFEDGNEDDPNSYWCIPSYTTQIDDAWNVVEKMRKSYYQINLRESDFGYECYFYRVPDALKPRKASIGSSASEAICLAALVATTDR